MQKRYIKRGMSLLELIAVVTLLGIVATVSVGSFRRGTMANVYAKTDATRLVTDLRLARSRAIATGYNHFFVFGNNGTAQTYTVYSRLPGGTTQATTTTYAFNAGVSVTVAPAVPEFTFEGDGLAGYAIAVKGPDRAFQITVNRVTGAVSLAAL